MFFIPAKLHLALNAALFIAYHARHDQPISGAMITRHYGMKKRALEAVLQTLCKANILESVKGNSGGYYMPKPAETRISDVAQCFIDDVVTDTHSAFGEFAPIVEPALSQGYDAWLASVAKVSFADLCTNATRADIQPFIAATPDFII